MPRTDVDSSYFARENVVSSRFFCVKARGNIVISRGFCVILRGNCDREGSKLLIFHNETASESRES